MTKQILAVVTGGVRGIGLAITKELLSNNAKVVVCSRNKEEVEKTCKELSVMGEIYGIECDVSKQENCKKLIDFAIEKLGDIDLLVNNAGIYGPMGSIEDQDVNQWRSTIEVNLMSNVYCSQLVVPMFKKNKGRIVNICGAGAGSKPQKKISAYYTSKMAVAAFTETLALELEEFGVNVNAISPGAVNTQMTDYLISQGVGKVDKDEYENAIEQKKTGGVPPELTAKMVLFLASDDSKNITGRLISAKWEKPEMLNEMTFTKNTFKLRRIDEQFYYEK